MRKRDSKLTPAQKAAATRKANAGQKAAEAEFARRSAIAHKAVATRRANAAAKAKAEDRGKRATVKAKLQTGDKGKTGTVLKGTIFGRINIEIVP